MFFFSFLRGVGMGWELVINISLHEKKMPKIWAAGQHEYTKDCVIGVNMDIIRAREVIREMRLKKSMLHASE